MKIVAPKSFTFYGDHRAVLLLHGFTGSTMHVRKLGRYLHEHGFTCHAPLYQGHGLAPEELLQTEPSDWWQDAVNGYKFLKEKGYEEIAVAGVSLGGVFALKVGVELPVNGVVTMSAPAKEKQINELQNRLLDYAKGYKKIEGKEARMIDEEVEELKQAPVESLKSLQRLILETGKQIHRISSTIMIMQGCLDEPLYIESAKMIHERVQTKEKRLRWYKNSGHILTLEKDQDQVFEDIHTFLNQLNW